MPNYKVQDTDINKRADVFLQEHLPNFSRSLIKQLTLKNQLIFNQKLIKANYKFKTTGQLKFSPKFKQSELNQSIKLKIIYEDDDLVVINKPAGIIVHARSNNWAEVSIASSLRQYLSWSKLTYPTTKEELRKGIVHRLDKGTSGVLICAKNDQTVNKLQLQFKQRLVQKTYLAITTKGTKLPQQALIDKPIARHLKDHTKFVADLRGRQSQTYFKIRQEYPGYYLLEIKPQTGRTHQIRVHLSSLNCPIVGDKLYKGVSASRLMLHAHEISFKHPTTDQPVTFKAELPKDFNLYLE